jgi:hypothetical protein
MDGKKRQPNQSMTIKYARKIALSMGLPAEPE